MQIQTFVYIDVVAPCSRSPPDGSLSKQVTGNPYLGVSIHKFQQCKHSKLMDSMLNICRKVNAMFIDKYGGRGIILTTKHDKIPFSGKSELQNGRTS